MADTGDEPARRVAVFGLGGTIAMTTTGTGGVAPALSASQLVAAVPGLAGSGIGVDTVDFRRLPGASLDFADVAALGGAIGEALDGGVDGVVVTQGTDTLEESAYLTDLYHGGEQPVVFAGAMRSPMMAGADGPANVLAAIRTAASQRMRGLGVLVVLADEIHAARRVRKTHSTSGGAFQSPTGGPVGHVVEGQPVLLNRLPARFTLPVPTAAGWPRVGLVTVTLGDRGELLDGLADRVDGLVVAGFGVGHVPDRLLPALGELAERVPVVLASRTGAGPVLTSTYGFPGSERDLLARGFVPAGFVDAVKARLLLVAALASGAGRDTVAAAFGAAGGCADPTTWPWTSR